MEITTNIMEIFICLPKRELTINNGEGERFSDTTSCLLIDFRINI